MSIKILLAGVVSTGCYQAIGTKDLHPPTPPALVDGADVQATDQVIELEALKINDAGNLVHKKKRVGTASYNGQELSIPRLEALADPDKWSKDVAHAQELRATCRHAEKPEIVAAIAGIAASALVIGLVSTHEGSGPWSSNEMLGVYGAGGLVGVMGASYVVGWFRGGKECEELKSFRREIYLDETDDMVNQSWDDVELINKLAAQFNERSHGQTPPAEPAPEESSSN